MRTDPIGRRSAIFMAGLLAAFVLIPLAAGAEVVKRASVATGGAQATGGHSLHPAISANGRFVAFDSAATNLVAGDTNGLPDVFVHDRVTGITTRVSVASDGSQGTGGVSGSQLPGLSADGRLVVFTSDATNLVPNDMNAKSDVFVRDRMTGITARVSVATGGAEGNGDSLGRAISADGRFVAFTSSATNLALGCGNPSVYVHDRLNATTTCVGTGDAPPAISADGRFIAFATPSPNRNVVIRDRLLGADIFMQRGDSPAISSDGRFVAFVPGGNVPMGCSAGPLSIVLHDHLAGTTSVVVNGNADGPAISADGRFIAFLSFPNQIGVLDRLTGNTTTVSVAADGTPANGGTFCNFLDPAGGTAGISADGRFVVFDTDASNLVSNDTNGLADVFVARLAAGPNWLVTGAGEGGGPHVRGFDATGAGTPLSFFPYPTGFTGGVRVAVGDVNGDGVPDLITGAGPGGGPHVQAFSGIDRALLMSFFAYAPGFTGGVYVAAGDVNGDGLADLITGADAGGGPHVQVFSGADGTLLQSFFAYSAAFTGGVRVAAGDVNGDGLADIITGAGPGGGPHVRAVNGANPAVELASFFAYPAAFTGGVDVAAGDVNGDGLADIITGAGPGGGPHVRVFNAANPTVELASFFAYPAAFTGGVRVAAGDINGDGLADIITGAGPGGGPHVEAFSGADGSLLASFFAYGSAFTGGVFVSGIQP